MGSVSRGGERMAGRPLAADAVRVGATRGMADCWLYLAVARFGALCTLSAACFCPHPPLPPRALPAHSGIAVAYSTLGSPSPLISPLSPRLPSLPSVPAPPSPNSPHRPPRQHGRHELPGMSSRA
ncbi:unnamed protein product [Closterium sp. NIES-64]|nr:unnamed protein product [Closterium sp. NIES-64]